MDELVIDINPRGKVEALHFDEFDLGFLGPKNISRASEIHFNTETQLWDIILPDRVTPECSSVAGFDSYDKARNFEVLWLQACRKGRTNPYTAAASRVALNLRKTYI